MNYLELKKLFESEKENLIFTKEQVESLLIENFKAKEFPFKQILDLDHYEFFEYEKIYKSYTIQDKSILANLFNEEEQTSHEEAKGYEELETYSKLEEDVIYNGIIRDEQRGLRIDIILESKDSKYITEFEVRVQCEKMDRYMNAVTLGALILKTKYNISDEGFNFYLENLDMFKLLG